MAIIGNHSGQNEIIPRVSIDTRFGKFVDHIDIDAHVIADRLRQGGVSDDDIQKLDIRIRADFIERERGMVTTGVYSTAQPSKSYLFGKINKKEKPERIEVGYSYLHEELPDVRTEIDRCVVSNVTEIIYGETLWHEIEHAIIKRDSTALLENKAYQRKNIRGLGYLLASAGMVYGEYGGRLTGLLTESGMAHVSIVMAAVCAGGLREVLFTRKGYSRYLNSPEEIRANAAEENAPEGLVTISAKSNVV